MRLNHDTSKLSIAVLATFGFLIATATSTVAQCGFCNASVRFDEAVAQCFLDRAEDQAARFDTEKRDFIIVDLSDCGLTGDRGSGLPLADDQSGQVSLDYTFVIDRQTLQCLWERVADERDSIAPNKMFDLTSICSAV